MANFATRLAIGAIGGGLTGFCVHTFMRRFLGQDSSQKTTLDVSKWGPLETRIDLLAKQLEIKNKIIFESMSKGITPASVSGSTLTSSSTIKVQIMPEEFGKMPSNAQEFVIAHELSHISHNDFLKTHLFSAGAVLIPFLALTILFPGCPYILTLSAPLIIRSIAISLYSPWREKLADKEAASLSPEIAKGGGAFYAKLYKRR